MNKMNYLGEIIKIMFTSLSTFDAIVYLILLLVTIWLAWKKPGKISAIGQIIVVMTIFCAVWNTNCLINEIYMKEPTFILPSGRVSEILHNLRGQYPEFREVLLSNFFSVMVYDLARIASSIVLGALTYIISNILYIIRTPRI